MGVAVADAALKAHSAQRQPAEIVGKAGWLKSMCD